MKLALMQPYVLPYIGYFQLIHACDTFVVHDDVQFIKGGWINRNRILIGGQDKLFTLPVAGGPATARIHERVFSTQWRAEVLKLRRMLEAGYRKAPHFQAVIALVDEIFAETDDNVARVATRSLQLTCRYLGIERQWRISSELDKDDTLKSQERVLEINRVLGARTYLNPPGGVELYDRDVFASRGLALQFVQPRKVEYPQSGGPFVPWLSIVDVLMWNDVEAVVRILTEYDLT